MRVNIRKLGEKYSTGSVKIYTIELAERENKTGKNLRSRRNTWTEIFKFPDRKSTKDPGHRI